jgi:hypothetical protein
MTTRIYDKKSGKFVVVTGSNGREDVSSRTASRMFYLSRDNGSVYSFRSKYAASANDCVLYYKNTSATENFYIEKLMFESDTDCEFTLSWVTGTASGTDVIGVNWNSLSGHVKSAIVKSSRVTGLTIGGEILDFDVISKKVSTYNTEGALIIGNGAAVVIKIDVAANVHVTIVGAYE